MNTIHIQCVCVFFIINSVLLTFMCPSLISRTVSVDVKHHVYLLTFMSLDRIFSSFLFGFYVCVYMYVPHFL